MEFSASGKDGRVNADHVDTSRMLMLPLPKKEEIVPLVSTLQ